MATRTLIENHNSQSVVTLPLPYGQMVPAGQGVIVGDDEATTITTLGGAEAMGRAGLVVTKVAEDQPVSATPSTDYVAALVAINANIGTPVATITALKAVAAAARSDKQLRVVEDDSQGRRAVYVFDDASTADADDVNIVTPSAGTGRWFRSHDLGTGELPIINATGGILAKGAAVYLSGWDATKNRFQVVVATNTDVTKPAVGVLAAALANTASGVLESDYLLAASGLATNGGAGVGDPVYLGTAGALTLTIPTTALIQIVGRVSTLAASGTLRINVRPPQPASVVVASAATPGLMTGADKAKLDGIEALADVTDNANVAAAGAVMSAGTGLEVAGGSVSLKESFLRQVTTNLTNAQVLALRATPIEVVPAAGGGKHNQFISAFLYFKRTAGYTESADNLAIKYLNGAGTNASETIETTGFLDAGFDAFLDAIPAPSVVSTQAAEVSAALVLHNTGDGEFGGGDVANVIRVVTTYRVFSLPS